MQYHSDIGLHFPGLDVSVIDNDGWSAMVHCVLSWKRANIKIKRWSENSPNTAATTHHNYLENPPLIWVWWGINTSNLVPFMCFSKSPWVIMVAITVRKVVVCAEYYPIRTTKKQLPGWEIGTEIAHGNTEFSLGNVNIHKVGMQWFMRPSYLASVDFPDPGSPLIKISTIVEGYSIKSEGIWRWCFHRELSGFWLWGL